MTSGFTENGETRHDFALAGLFGVTLAGAPGDTDYDCYLHVSGSTRAILKGIDVTGISHRNMRGEIHFTLTRRESR